MATASIEKCHGTPWFRVESNLVQYLASGSVSGHERAAPTSKYLALAIPKAGASSMNKERRGERNHVARGSHDKECP